MCIRDRVATFTDLVLRVVLAYLFSAEQGARGIWMSWPAGWVIASVLSCVFYFTGVWIPKRFRIDVYKRQAVDARNDRKHQLFRGLS